MHAIREKQFRQTRIKRLRLLNCGHYRWVQINKRRTMLVRKLPVDIGKVLHHPVIPA